MTGHPIVLFNETATPSTESPYDPDRGTVNEHGVAFVDAASVGRRIVKPTVRFSGGESAATIGGASQVLGGPLPVDLRGAPLRRARDPETGLYRLGLGTQSRQLEVLRDRIRPWLEKPRDELGETVNLVHPAILAAV